MSTRNHSAIANVVRFSLRIVGVLALVVLALLLVAIAVNLHDQPLSSEATALSSPPDNPYIPAENIYVSMAGFDAPAAYSVVTTGEARIEKYNQGLDWTLAHPTDPAAYDTKSDPEKLKFSGVGDLCRSLPSSVWADAKKRRLEIGALLRPNRELLQRYLELHRLHGYHETARPSYLAPFYFVPQAVRCLFLLDAAERMQTGTLQQQRAAIDDLSQDLRLWKLMLQGDGTLISKMIAAASIHRDLEVLADAVSDPQTDMVPFEGEQGAPVEPFPATDWNIGNAFGAEFRAILPMYSQMMSVTWAMGRTDESQVTWWQRRWFGFQMLFFKPTATENSNAELMMQLTKLAVADPQRFSEAQEKYRAWLKDNESRYSPRMLFNPIGRILIFIAAPQYENYIVRAYDVAAFQRLVYLAYQIRRQGIEVRDIPTFLKQHPEWSTHPVNGTAFRWNPQSRELIVDPVGPNTGRRFTVSVYQQAGSG